MTERRPEILCICRWLADRSGTAIAEFALAFPILMTMLVGVFELGNGILVNQKSIAAAQTVADLITRYESVDEDIIEEVIEAGELALGSNDLTSLGIDIISVAFNDDDVPEVVWRETTNIEEPQADDDVATRATGLGTEGDGVVIVIVRYTYTPLLAYRIIGDIEMEEVSFARGRFSAIVCFEDDCEA